MSTATLPVPTTTSEEEARPKFGYIATVRDVRLDFLLHDLPQRLEAGQYRDNTFVEENTRKEVIHLCVEKWYRSEYSKKHEGQPYLSFVDWYWSVHLKQQPR